MKLRIGHLSTFYHTAILLMARRDTNERLGVEAEWKLYGTGPAIVDAFARDELDMAYLGLPPAIIGIARGVKIVCIAGGHIEGTVLAGKAEWKAVPEGGGVEAALRQFRGRSIGVPGKGSIHDVILREYVSRSGLQSDIEVKNFPWADLVLEAVVRDEVSAALGTPALAAAVKRYAAGKILCPAALLWPNNPSYGIVVSRKHLKTGGEKARKFLELHEEATEHLRNRPEEAARTIADYVAIVDPELVLDALRISPRYCAALTDDYMSATLNFARTLRTLGYVGREPSREEIFDTSIITKIHPGREHYSEGIRTV